MDSCKEEANRSVRAGDPQTTSPGGRQVCSSECKTLPLGELVQPCTFRREAEVWQEGLPHPLGRPMGLWVGPSSALTPASWARPHPVGLGAWWLRDSSAFATYPIGEGASYYLCLDFCFITENSSCAEVETPV